MKYAHTLETDTLDKQKREGKDEEKQTSGRETKAKQVKYQHYNECVYSLSLSLLFSSFNSHKPHKMPFAWQRKTLLLLRVLVRPRARVCVSIDSQQMWTTTNKRSRI